jgi:hypothetical protein
VGFLDRVAYSQDTLAVFSCYNFDKSFFNWFESWIKKRKNKVGFKP